MPPSCPSRLPGLRGKVVPLRAFGIACRGPVRSVQLFSETPLEFLLRDRAPIYATPKSRTSVELFRILCQRVYGVAPILTAAYPRGAAHLLIGDAAYEYAATHGDSPHNIDLGEWWLAHTGLPFVYARWVVSPALDSGACHQLANWLDACADRAKTPEGLAQLAAGECDSSATMARYRYYERLLNRLDEDVLAGQNRFLKLLEGAHYESAARIA